MKISLQNNEQFKELELKIKLRLYDGVNKLYQKNNNYVRLIAFPVGLAKGVLTISARVALLAESLFKGVINIAGSRFSEKCDLKTGLKQIFKETPINIALLPVSFLQAIILDLFYDTFLYTIVPSHFMKDYEILKKKVHPEESAPPPEFKKSEAPKQEKTIAHPKNIRVAIQLLGLDPKKEHTIEKVKKACRATAKQYHPDKNDLDIAEAQTKEVLKAKATILDYLEFKKLDKTPIFNENFT